MSVHIIVYARYSMYIITYIILSNYIFQTINWRYKYSIKHNSTALLIYTISGVTSGGERGGGQMPPSPKYFQLPPVLYAVISVEIIVHWEP